MFQNKSLIAVFLLSLHSATSQEQHPTNDARQLKANDWKKDAKKYQKEAAKWSSNDYRKEAEKWITDAEKYIEYDVPCYESSYCAHGKTHQCTSGAGYAKRSVTICCPGKSKDVFLPAIYDCQSLKSADIQDVEDLNIGGRKLEELDDNELLHRISEIEQVFDEMELGVEDAAVNIEHFLRDTVDAGRKITLEVEAWMTHVGDYIANEMPCYESPFCGLGGSSYRCTAHVGRFTRSANICCPSENREIVLGAMYDCSEGLGIWEPKTEDDSETRRLRGSAKESQQPSARKLILNEIGQGLGNLGDSIELGMEGIGHGMHNVGASVWEGMENVGTGVQHGLEGIGNKISSLLGN